MLRALGDCPPYLLEEVSVPLYCPQFGPSSYGQGFMTRKEAEEALEHMQYEKWKLGPCGCQEGLCNIWEACQRRGIAKKLDGGSEDTVAGEYMIVVQMQVPSDPKMLFTPLDAFTERGFLTINAARKWLSRWREQDRKQGGKMDYRPTLWKLLRSEKSERGC